jgi:hypothetical protein
MPIRTLQCRQCSHRELHNTATPVPDICPACKSHGEWKFADDGVPERSYAWDLKWHDEAFLRSIGIKAE